MKIYKINNKEYTVSINSCTDTQAVVTVNDKVYQVEMTKVNQPVVNTPKYDTQENNNLHDVESGAKSEGGGTFIAAPLPGVILDIKVKNGDSIKVGQTIAILEAMKMENEILSEFNGVVSSVEVNPGDSVLEGTVIIKFV